MVVRPIFPYVQRFKDKRLLGNMEQLAKLLDTNHLETWEDMRAFEEMLFCKLNDALFATLNDAVHA